MELIGTPKQVECGTRMRAEHIAQWDAHIARYVAMGTPNSSAVAAVMQQMADEAMMVTCAGDWITSQGPLFIARTNVIKFGAKIGYEDLMNLKHLGAVMASRVGS